VDFDACWIDGQRIETMADWPEILQRSALSAVNGPFALAWREPDGACCLARDHIGERSLFYATAGDRLIFGSSVASVLATGLVRPVINHTALARYLSYGYLPGRDTLLHGIFKVLPA
jgi:asparagine synthase (glutamine-hydrolysing)